MGMIMTQKQRVFISFDFDNDESQRNLLVGQSKNEDVPFSFEDWSVKAHMTGDWVAKVTTKIRSVDQVIVLCGRHTHLSDGISKELEIARQEKKPYFLLGAYNDNACTLPRSAAPHDKIYKWSWDNIRLLLRGSR